MDQYNKSTVNLTSKPSIQRDDKQKSSPKEIQIKAKPEYNPPEMIPKISSEKTSEPAQPKPVMVKQPAKKGKKFFYLGQAYTEICVKKWVDYSTKYGLGYLLTDGSTGVYFNDSTKIILDKNGDNFDYIEKKGGEKADTITPYKLSNFPPERQLQKKVTLLQHFKNYLYSDQKS